MITLELSEEILKKFTDIANNSKKTVMENVSIIEEQEEIKSACSSILDIDSYHYGNVFSHREPFTIHSDISNKKKTILLIPISAHKTQKFVVFDQTINQDKPVSWIYNIFDDKTEEELEKMYYSSSLRTRPYDTPNVKNLVNNPISDELYQHLPFSKELYYGLTGVAWDYKPGTALLFEANRIHATGKMLSSKIGCTIQFTDSIDTLRSSLKVRTLS